MMLYASSCERPSKSSPRVFLPCSVSNSYAFSTGTQGRSRRFLLISSFRSACSASSLASPSRATCHSLRVPILCSGISSPSIPTGTAERHTPTGLQLLPARRPSSDVPRVQERARIHEGCARRLLDAQPILHAARSSARQGDVAHSFTGAITRPREVLENGYLSWLNPMTGTM